MRFEERALVSADPRRVWAVATDWERQVEWMPDVAWIRVPGPRGGVGATVVVRTKVFGLPLVTDQLEVTAWDPPRRLSMEHRGIVRGAGEWRLEPQGRGTRFRWIDDLRIPLPVLGNLALLAYAPVQRRILRRSLRNLARLVEQTS